MMLKMTNVPSVTPGSRWTWGTVYHVKGFSPDNQARYFHEIIMIKSYLPAVEKVKRQPKGDWKLLSQNYLFGFVSSLAGVGIKRQAGRILIDIDQNKVASMTPEDWAEVQAAAGLFEEE